MTGIATPIHLGRSMAAFEVVITNEEGKRVCTSRITCALLDRALTGSGRPQLATCSRPSRRAASTLSI